MQPERHRTDPAARDAGAASVRTAIRRLLARELEGLVDALRRGLHRARRAWERRPSLERAAALAVVAGLALASAAAMVHEARRSRGLPSDRDWAAVAALLERDARRGDAVALAPPWAERARERLPPDLPVLAQARYAGEDLVGVRRIWVLSLDRTPGFSWGPELDLLDRGLRAGPPERVGAFAVARYDLGSPTLPLAFLPDRLAGAAVSRGAAPCPRDARGTFRCGGTSVAREVREVAGAPRPCAVVALEPGAPVAIAFPQVRVGRLVRGHAGALDEAAPLRISVVVSGEEAGAAEVTGAGFRAFQVDTARFAGEGRSVALVLTTPGPARGGVTEICLDAMTLP